MTTIVDARIPANQFALSETFNQCPDSEFEILRMVAHGSDRVLPFLWATSDDLDALPNHLEEDSSTKNIRIISEFDDEYLLKMEWMAHIRVILYILIEENATILHAHGLNDQWRLRILFQEHDSVSKTYDFCDEYDIPLEFERIIEQTNSFRSGHLGLTEDQYETIRQAYEFGYYEVPRDVHLEELADQLEVSHQALSERLRRGHETLIANSLHVDTKESLQP